MPRSMVREILQRIERGEIVIQRQPSEQSFEEWLERRKAEAEALERLTAEDWETRYP